MAAVQRHTGINAAARRSAVTWEQEWLPEIQANLARLNQMDLGALPDGDLAAVLDDALRILARHWEIHFTISFAVVNEFERWHRNRFPDAPATEAQQLLQGQMNASLASDRALWQLARGFDALTLSDYLTRYGARPAIYCDLGAPTWAEAPAPVLHLIEKYGSMADPAARVAAMAATAADLARRVSERLEPAERPAFAELLTLARATARMKEDHSFWIEQQTTGAVRRICVAFGRRLTGAGILRAPGDVALLTLAELLAFGAGQVQPHLPQAIVARGAEWAANRQVRPAPWVGATPEDDEPAPPIATAWQGMGVSAGKVVGPARVVYNLAEAYQVQPGEILVCRETDPGWTALFGLAAGLVLDTFAGGMLSHAAIVAREYQLPTVVRAEGILASVRSGQVLAIDGTTGAVALVQS
ncbi:MAG: phosphoenolpyruvate synthase-related protein [Firmicutes bacterium]|nr:phosphoenolpyruvate synthase-related protein [Bacillota bacterium]